MPPCLKSLAELLPQRNLEGGLKGTLPEKSTGIKMFKTMATLITGHGVLSVFSSQKNRILLRLKLKSAILPFHVVLLQPVAD